ncbi:MAG: SemiSWEET transporter [Gammaproteobacteria bacterium]|nr:SemiSWEET transporter [Gammaproteobacteria bacterium]MBU1733508.1 SemiSWEET transporter [Gammaproteobacteria bacterium]MBU1893166.1 SemiSWEET transporter [Gammaproteobacteria bacterium]
MTDANLLGMAAGTLTTVAFVPQVLKTWRSKSAGDVSYGMFLIFSSGVFLWLLYGLAIGATPIVVANAVTLVLALTMLVLKRLYR